MKIKPIYLIITAVILIFIFQSNFKATIFNENDWNLVYSQTFQVRAAQAGDWIEPDMIAYISDTYNLNYALTPGKGYALHLQTDSDYSWFYSSQCNDLTINTYINGVKDIDCNYIDHASTSSKSIMGSNADRIREFTASGTLTKVDVYLLEWWNPTNRNIYVKLYESKGTNCDSLKLSALQSITLWVNSPSGTNKVNALNTIINWANCGG